MNESFQGMELRLGAKVLVTVLNKTPSPPLLDVPARRKITSEFLDETYPAKLEDGATYGGNCMILTSTVFLTVTDRQTDKRTDGRTDGDSI